MFDAVQVRGFTPNGDAAELFSVADGKATWTSPVDRGSADYAVPAMYAAFGGPMDLTAHLVEKLVATPGKTLKLLPGGQLRAELLTTVTLGNGASKQRVTAYAVTGLANTPVPVWVDERGRFFAMVGSLSWMPDDRTDARPVLQKAQDEALARRSPGILKSLLQSPSGPVAFTHVRAFVDGDRFVDDETVVVDHGLIASVEPSAAASVPEGSPDHRRGGQDPRTWFVGFAHAFRRRCERTDAALAGHHLRPGSGQRQRTHYGARPAPRRQ